MVTVTEGFTDQSLTYWLGGFSAGSTGSWLNIGDFYQESTGGKSLKYDMF